VALDNEEQLGADLSAYLDGELDPKRTSEIELLLERSEEARALLTKLRGMSRQLGDLPRMKAPEDLIDSLPARRKLPIEQTRARKQSFNPRSVWLTSKIAASAAVIVVCFYTGWIMHERMTAAPRAVAMAVQSPPATPALVDEKSAVRGEKGVTSPERDFESEQYAKKGDDLASDPLEQLEALGYVGGYDESEDEPVVAVLPPEPILAARESKKDEPEEADARTAGAEIDSEPAAMPWLADFTPTVEILVTPQDQAQFAAALDAVSVWSSPAGGGGAGRCGLREDVSQQDFTIRSSPEQVSDLLRALEERTPRQVSVAMKFRSAELTQIRQMITPVAEGEPGLSETDAYAGASREPADSRAERDTGTDSGQESEETAPAFAKAEASPEEVAASKTDFDAFRARGAMARRVGARGRVERDRIVRQDELAESRAPTNARPKRPGKGGETRKAKSQDAAPLTSSSDRRPTVNNVARPTSESLRPKPPRMAAAEMKPTETDVQADKTPDSAPATPALKQVDGNATQPPPSAREVALRITIIPPPPVSQPASGAD